MTFLARQTVVQALAAEHRGASADAAGPGTGRAFDLPVGFACNVFGDAVASAIKDWAAGRGATHDTHWFQPRTGSRPRSTTSFLSPTSDGRALMEFSGKEPIEGELAVRMRDELLPAMLAVRAWADLLETLVDDHLWPLPKHGELLSLD